MIKSSTWECDLCGAIGFIEYTSGCGVINGSSPSGWTQDSANWLAHPSASKSFCSYKCRDVYKDIVAVATVESADFLKGRLADLLREHRVKHAK